MLPDFKMKGRGSGSPDVNGTQRRIHVFGRSPSVDVRLQDVTVSELHAAIVRDVDGVWLVDLGSRNLVRVGEQVTRRQRLADGNRIDIGPFSWRISLSGKPGSGGLRSASLVEKRTDRVIELAEVVTTIGRREHSRIRLDEESVSRVHALLVRTVDGLLVRNLSRRTGTIVNDQRLEETLLQQGDILRIGKATFEVDLSAATSLRTADRGSGRGASIALEIEAALGGEQAPDTGAEEEAESTPGKNALRHPAALTPDAADEQQDDLRVELPDEDFWPGANDMNNDADSRGPESGKIGRKSPVNQDLNEWLDQLYSPDDSEDESSKDDKDGGTG